MADLLESNLLDFVLGGGLVFLMSVLLCSLASSAFLVFFLRTPAVSSYSSAPMVVQDAEWRLWLFALTPVWVGLCSGVLLIRPNWLSFWFIPHCHGELCGVHSPDLADASGSAIVAITSLLLLASGMLVLMLALWWWNWQRRQRRLLLLETLSVQDDRLDLLIVPSQQLLAWCGGLLKPRIYLSQGVLDQLSEGEQQLILVHEHSHLWRRDNLRRWLLQLVLRCWPSKARRLLTQEYQRMTEQLADELVLNQGFSVTELIGLRQRLDPFEPQETWNHRGYRGDRGCEEGAALDLQDNASGRALPGIWPAGLWLGLFLMLQILLFSGVLHPVLDEVFLGWL